MSDHKLPTNKYFIICCDLSRGMALCFVMMFGRIGGVAGSNFLGAVINGYCGVIFIVAALVLVRMYRTPLYRYYMTLIHFLPSQWLLVSATISYKRLNKSPSDEGCSLALI